MTDKKDEDIVEKLNRKEEEAEEEGQGEDKDERSDEDEDEDEEDEKTNNVDKEKEALNGNRNGHKPDAEVNDNKRSPHDEDEDENKPVYGDTVIPILEPKEEDKLSNKGSKDVPDTEKTKGGACLLGAGICTVACCVLIHLTISCIPLAMIVVGAVFINDCPAIKAIPILLMTTGSFAIVSGIMTSVKSARDKKKVSSGPLEGILSIASTICFIVFASYVFTNPWPSYEKEDASLGTYCHQFPYLFSFCFVAAVLSLFAVIFLAALIGLCVWCVAVCCFGVWKRKIPFHSGAKESV